MKWTFRKLGSIFSNVGSELEKYLSQLSAYLASMRTCVQAPEPVHHSQTMHACHSFHAGKVDTEDPGGSLASQGSKTNWQVPG